VKKDLSIQKETEMDAFTLSMLVVIGVGVFFGAVIMIPILLGR